MTFQVLRMDGHKVPFVYIWNSTPVPRKRRLFRWDLQTWEPYELLYSEDFPGVLSRTTSHCGSTLEKRDWIWSSLTTRVTERLIGNLSPEKEVLFPKGWTLDESWKGSWNVSQNKKYDTNLDFFRKQHRTSEILGTDILLTRVVVLFVSGIETKFSLTKRIN